MDPLNSTLKAWKAVLTLTVLLWNVLPYLNRGSKEGGSHSTYIVQFVKHTEAFIRGYKNKTDLIDILTCTQLNHLFS